MYSNILKRELHFDDSGHERLNVYRLSYRLAMEIFEVSKKFPKEEMYSLTDQVRRSSRQHPEKFAPGHSASTFATAPGNTTEIKLKESK